MHKTWPTIIWRFSTQVFFTKSYYVSIINIRIDAQRKWQFQSWTIFTYFRTVLNIYSSITLCWATFVLYLYWCILYDCDFACQVHVIMVTYIYLQETITLILNLQAISLDDLLNCRNVSEHYFLEYATWSWANRMLSMASSILILHRTRLRFPPSGFTHLRLAVRSTDSLFLARCNNAVWRAWQSTEIEIEG